MSIKNVVAFVGCCIVSAAIPSASHGQIGKDAYSPFEPGYFEHDMQFFAPGEFDEFGGESNYPIGWYFNYNRMYVHASRPFSDFQRTKRDPTWGNRFQVAATASGSGAASSPSVIAMGRCSWPAIRRISCRPPARLA